MQREQRYIVLKLKDIEAARERFPTLTCCGNMVAFNQVCDAVTLARGVQGKPLLECVVVEKDWPEYETVWQMIANRVDNKEEPIQKLFEKLRNRFSIVPHDEIPLTREEFNELFAAYSAWSIRKENFPNIGEFPMPVDVASDGLPKLSDGE